MSQERLAPQQPAECLIQSRKSSNKGGTVIAPDVWTVQEHRNRLADPKRPYRPEKCPACGCDKLHVHDYRERHPLGLVLVVVLLVVRFVCVNPQCRATWRVLPAFLARHLWWQWRDIEQSTIGATPMPVATEALGATRSTAPTATSPASVTTPATGSGGRARMPSKRSTQRWRQRLGASARQLIELMAKRGGSVLGAIECSLCVCMWRRCRLKLGGSSRVWRRWSKSSSGESG
jgi:hypothetical protein